MGMHLNKIIVVFLSLSLCACTSFYPVNPSSGDIQSEVRAGTAVKVGDRVRIVMIDAAVHDLVVTDLTATTIVGENVEYSIDDIVSIDVRKPSTGKTTGLVAGTVIVVGLVIMLINGTKNVIDDFFEVAN